MPIMKIKTFMQQLELGDLDTGLLYLTTVGQ
jgi:hypothetical protein